MALHVVKKTAKPTARLLECPRCKGREVFRTLIGVTVKPDGKLSGGTPAVLCAQCHRAGQRVMLA